MVDPNSGDESRNPNLDEEVRLAIGTKRALEALATDIERGAISDPATLDSHSESFAVYAIHELGEQGAPLLDAIASGGHAIARALGSARINRRLLEVARLIRNREITDYKSLARYRITFSEFTRPSGSEDAFSIEVRAGGLAIVDALDDVGFRNIDDIDIDDLARST